MKVIKTIIIANIAEAFETTINNIKITNQKRRRTKIEHDLCDRVLFWEGDNKLIITPFPISKEIFERNKKILGFKNVDNLYPKKVDISLSDAIIQDEMLLSTLCDIIKNNQGVKLTSYCVTKKFILFVEYLKNKGLEFGVAEIPHKESSWLISYFDSKIGSRMEVSGIKDAHINIPKSIICRNKEEAIDAAEWFYKNNYSCVLKANFGESGWGIIFIKKEYFSKCEEISEYIKKEFKIDPIWDEELILTEEYIDSNKFSNFPSSEMFLSEKGVEITYLCDQIIGDKGDFLGVSLGKKILNNHLSDEIRRISLLIGRRFREAGYRGFFDIDFVLSQNNIPYVIETNMRRTGGTHVYDATKMLLGKNWEKEAFVMSQDNFWYGNEKLNEKQIMDKMDKIAYPIRGEKRGVIISIISKWQPIFGFIIIEKSNKKAMNIYNKMLNIWKINN